MSRRFFQIYKNMKPRLRVLNAYTGTEDLKSALKNPQSVKMLWLEILFNDSFNWESNLKNPILKAMKDSVAHSPQDSSLASFKKSVMWFILRIVRQPLTSDYFEKMAGILNTKGKLTQALLDERKADKEAEEKN